MRLGETFFSTKHDTTPSKRGRFVLDALLVFGTSTEDAHVGVGFFTRALKVELAMIEHSAPLRELTAARSEDENALVESLCVRSTVAATCRAMDEGVELAPMMDATK